MKTIAAAIFLGFGLVAGAIVWANRIVPIEAQGNILLLDRFTGELIACANDPSYWGRGGLTVLDRIHFICQSKPGI